MKTEKEIKERIEEIKVLITHLLDSGNIREIAELVCRAKALKWVLED